MLRRQPQRLFVVAGANHAQHRPEDFVGVDRHVGSDMVEQGRPDEEAALQVRIAFRQPKGQVVAGAVAAVNDQLGTGGHTLADVVAHPRQRRPVTSGP